MSDIGKVCPNTDKLLKALRVATEVTQEMIASKATCLGVYEDSPLFAAKKARDWEGLLRLLLSDVESFV